MAGRCCWSYPLPPFPPKIATMTGLTVHLADSRNLHHIGQEGINVYQSIFVMYRFSCSKHVQVGRRQFLPLLLQNILENTNVASLVCHYLHERM